MMHDKDEVGYTHSRVSLYSFCLWYSI